MTLHIELHTFLMHLQCISKALLHTLMHCISDSACYATLHCPLHLCLHTCCPCLFVCLFVSPSGLFPVRVHLRLGTCYVLVLTELRHICRMDTQGDKSLLDA